MSLFGGSWSQLRSPANQPMVEHHPGFMDTCAGDVLLMADEIATGRVGSVAFCVREYERRFQIFHQSPQMA